MHNERNRGYFATNTVFQSKILSSKESKQNSQLPSFVRTWSTTKEDEENYRGLNETDLYSDNEEHERRKIVGPIRNPGIGECRRWKNSNVEKLVNRPRDIKTYSNIKKKIPIRTRVADRSRFDQ